MNINSLILSNNNNTLINNTLTTEDFIDFTDDKNVKSLSLNKTEDLSNTYISLKVKVLVVY
jgi:hypothetical protein